MLVMEMSRKEQQIPAIRFNGFTDAWEQRKFSDYYKISSGFAFKLQDYEENGVPIVNGESIKHGVVSSNNFNYLPDSYRNKYPQFILNAGDIVLGLNRPITNGELKIARIPDKLDKSLLYQRAGRIEYNKPINKEFSFVLLDKEIFKYTLKEAVGSDQPFISTTNLAKWKMGVPSSKIEMEKIGVFFNRLNETIALHQRQLDNYKELKKSMLQKMLPQEEEKVPEIRFDGFTGGWEQRKLIDVAEMFDNLRIPVTASDRVQGNTAYYGANGIQDYVDGFTHDGEFVLIAEDGANDLINYPVNYVKGKIWVNNHAHVVSGKKSELDNLFLTARIKSMNISHWLVGGGRAKLNGDVLKKIPLTLPVYEEQKKIGAFFKQLDDAIALHQQKVTDYQQLKKAMFQQMFV